jgi:hypothetical protein
MVIVGFLILMLQSVTSALSATTMANEPTFVRLDGPPDEMRSFPDACPIRLEIPLDDLMPKLRSSFKTRKTRSVACERAVVDKIKVTKVTGRWSQADKRVVVSNGGDHYFHIDYDVYLPKGADKLISTTFRLLQGEATLAEAKQQLEGDEGELNWGSGVDLVVKDRDVASPGSLLLLQVEVFLGDQP